MNRSPWLRGWIPLVLLALWACTGPMPASEATTATPPVRPTTLKPMATGTAFDPGSTPTLPPIPTPQPGFTLAPTMPPLSPMPTADAPLSQLLPQIGPHVLLHSQGRGSLLLSDLDQPQRWIVLNPGLCVSTPDSRAYGSWSGDGRFIAFVCITNAIPAKLYLVSLQTAEVLEIDSASVIGINWSFRDSHLLVTTLSLGAESEAKRQTYLLDATTGTRIDLPVAASFEETGYAGVGSLWRTQRGYLARIAWSPDGTKLAVVGDNAVYVADADGGNGRSFPQASDPALYRDSDWNDGGRFRGGPVWSADGQTIYVTRLLYFRRFTTPSGSISSRAAAIDITTGAVHRAEYLPERHDTPEGSRASQYMDTRSPDGAFRVDFMMTGDTGQTVVVDSQNQVRLTITSLEYFMGWRPVP